MKLISMTDFVLEENKQLKNAPDAYEQYCNIVNYANFLKQPLKYWMFIPCDEDSNFLQELKPYQDNYFKYEKAKERCLFDGFEFQDANEDNPMPYIYLGEEVTLYPEVWEDNHTIEDLLYWKEFIILSKTAIKQIGL